MNDMRRDESLVGMAMSELWRVRFRLRLAFHARQADNGLATRQEG